MILEPKDTLRKSTSQLRKCNFTILTMKFKASLEALCEIIIFALRCQQGRFEYSEKSEVSIKMARIKFNTNLYLISFNEEIEKSQLYKVFEGTPYSEVVYEALKNIHDFHGEAFNGKSIRFIKIEISYDNCFNKTGEQKIPFRYRTAVSFMSEGDPYEYYSEYWEDLGWLIMDNSSLSSSTARLINDTFNSGFFMPIIDLNSLYYNKETGKFQLNGIDYNLRDMTPKLKIIDLNTGTVFTMIDSSSELEPNSVLVPFKIINVYEAIENKSIVEQLCVIPDSNGVDTYLMLRSVRASTTLLAKLLTYIYTEEYYQDIVQLCIPRRFSQNLWKFTESLSPSEIYKHVIGMNIVIEFNSILDIPSDRLSKLGISIPQVIEKTRKSYDWLCSSNWKMNWNEILQKSLQIVDNIQVPFNFNNYAISLHLTKIEAMFYFISCLQRYLMLIYMKLLSNVEKHENSCSICLALGFNNLVLSAIHHMRETQDSGEKSNLFFRDRSITLNRNTVNISGLTGNVSIMKTNEIYIKWSEISNAKLRGNNLEYGEKRVNLTNNVEKTYQSIIDFIFSDLIKVFGYTTKEFINSSFPNIVEKIDFKLLYSVATNTLSINHKRLCIELCKYYCEFYGNELIIEDYE